jgi:hypothetical protein
MRSLFIAVLVATLSAQAVGAHEISLDGKLDESVWSTAFVCSHWQRVEPFARDTPRFRNEARVLATPQGLAVGFVLEHPPSERRVKPQMPRDAEVFYGESVSFMVDPDLSGQVGYEFSVALGGGIRDGIITNQKVFDRDWDGRWSRAVHEDETQWSVELLIPWSTIRLRREESDKRSIGVFFNRQLFDRAERFACPGISDKSAVFLSDFQPIEIDSFNNELGLSFAPYATMLTDNVRDHTRWKGGGEIFWRPIPQLQTALTINPDFGQVESDELVVDFSAIETVFTDKRPFFTEDQGIFEVLAPGNGQLIYTRRIGGARDDGLHGSSDIDAALKVTGEARAVRYGFFGAQEDEYEDDVGRRFAASRVIVPVGHHRVGLLSTWTDRPFLDRKALVNEIDYEYTGSSWWRVAAQIARSDIDESGRDADGYLSSLQVDMNRSGAFTHTLELLRMDRRYDMNDLGYMERNALRQVQWESTWRRSFEPGTSWLNGVIDVLRLTYRENSDGQRLPSRLQLIHDAQTINGWRLYQDLRYSTSGVDDLISRGNGIVRQRSRLAGFLDAESPRYGRWQYYATLYGYQQGVSGYSGWSELSATFYARENLSLRLNLIPAYSADWLLWEGERLFGSYRARRCDLDFAANWFPAPNHELRVRWQWIGIDAEPNQAYRNLDNGTLVETNDALRPFTVNNLGLQIRYRYEFAPLSELFLVYSRGGFNILEDERSSLGRLFADSVDVRDADQFLIKVRLRL